MKRFLLVGLLFVAGSAHCSAVAYAPEKENVTVEDLVKSITFELDSLVADLSYEFEAKYLLASKPLAVTLRTEHCFYGVVGAHVAFNSTVWRPRARSDL